MVKSLVRVQALSEVRRMERRVVKIRSESSTTASQNADQSVVTFT